jgi:hypothetical protein
MTQPFRIKTDLYTPSDISSDGALIIGPDFDDLNTTALISALSNNATALLVYDFTDNTTLLQERNGTNPVTNVSQNVGLILDKAQGLSLGPELITNGLFNNNDTTGWVISSGSWLVSNEKLNYIGSYNRAHFSLPSGLFLVGRFYEVKLEVSNYVSGSVVCYLATSGNPKRATFILAGNGSYTFFLSPTETVSGFGFEGNTLTGSLTIDNVSVRELPGYHATAPTDAARGKWHREPITGRRNLLTFTEDLTNAVWIRTEGANTAIQTDNGFTTLSFTSTSTDRRNAAYQAVPVVPSGEQGFIRARFRPGSGVTRLALGTRSSGAVFGWASYNITNGTWENYSISTPGTFEGLSAIEVTTGVWELIVRYTSPSVDRPGNILVHFGSGSASDLRLNSPVCSCDVGFVQWSRTNSAYQRVTNANDITEEGVPDAYSVLFDGSDDCFQTKTVNVGGATHVQVFAAVRKLSDVVATIAETGTNSTDFGGWIIYADPPSTRYVFSPRGNRVWEVNDVTPVSGFPAPDTAVLYARSDLTNGPAQMRRNAATFQNSVSTTWGGGSFANLVLNIGRRNASSLPFNGHIRSLIIRYSTSELSEDLIAAAEEWTAERAGFKAPVIISAPIIGVS